MLQKVSTFQTTLTTNLNVTHNYLNNLITLFSNLYLFKFLFTLWQNHSFRMILKEKINKVLLLLHRIRELKNGDRWPYRIRPRSCEWQDPCPIGSW